MERFKTDLDHLLQYHNVEAIEFHDDDLLAHPEIDGIFQDEGFDIPGRVIRGRILWLAMLERILPEDSLDPDADEYFWVWKQ